MWARANDSIVREHGWRIRRMMRDVVTTAVTTALQTPQFQDVNARCARDIVGTVHRMLQCGCISIVHLYNLDKFMVRRWQPCASHLRSRAPEYSQFFCVHYSTPYMNAEVFFSKLFSKLDVICCIVKNATGLSSDVMTIIFSFLMGADGFTCTHTSMWPHMAAVFGSALQYEHVCVGDKITMVYA